MTFDGCCPGTMLASSVQISDHRTCNVAKNKLLHFQGILEHLTFAALSKMFAAASTYPYQVVRLRLQDQHVRYDGVIDVVKKTWR